jgi:DNA-directed RNA polymerase specialized sigma24 family protein
MAKAKPREAEEPPATIEEITTAINSLTKGELIRLRKFAYRRYWTLGRRGAGLSPEDLLQNALVAVLEGRRKWKGCDSHCDHAATRTAFRSGASVR